MSSKEYIHYGSASFDINKFNPVKNRFLPIAKPTGGFWASPTNSKNNWHDWCIDHDYKIDNLTESFTFRLKPNAKLISIKSMDDVKKVIEIQNQIPLSFRKSRGIDYEGFIYLGYDAVEVYINNFDMYMYFYGWDVDSILIMNPNCVEM